MDNYTVCPAIPLFPKCPLKEHILYFIRLKCIYRDQLVKSHNQQLYALGMNILFSKEM